MSRDSERDRRPANIIVEAGEILQKLKPPRLATLLFVTDDEIETQLQMANILDVSSSTITTHLQKLENLPISLVIRGQEYNITPAGDTVLGYFALMMNRLGENLRDIDWADESDRERIGDLLSPLHNSRTIVPFFVLASIGQRSTVEGRIGVFAPSQPVKVKDIVSDVKHWQEERGETATKKQVRWLLGRFEEAGTIKFTDEDETEVKLEEEGIEHAKLLEQVIELIEDDRKDSEESSRETSSSFTQQDIPSTRPETTEQAPDAGRSVGPQLGLEGFYEDKQKIVSAENPTIVPAYGVSSLTDDERRSQSQSSPVLAFAPSTTVGDLRHQLDQIGREYGDDAPLSLVWTTLSSETADRSDDHGQNTERSKLQQ
jgi:hypothetical protein